MVNGLNQYHETQGTCYIITTAEQHPTPLSACVCTLMQRRYVIDYYYDDGAVDEEGMPKLHSEGAVKSIKVAFLFVFRCALYVCFVRELTCAGWGLPYIYTHHV